MTKNDKIKALKNIISAGDPSVLQKLYSLSEGHGLTRQEIMKVWYGLTSVSSLDEAELGTLYTLAARASETFDSSDRKERYFSESGVSKNIERILRALFTRLKLSERKLRKDVSEFSHDELCNAISKSGAYRIRNLRTEISPLNAYLKWCSEQDFGVHQDWKDAKTIKVEDIDIKYGMKEYCVGSPRELLFKIGADMPLDDGYIVPVAACLIWMGFELDEIVTIRDEEFDFIKGKIRERKIPREFSLVLWSATQRKVVTRPNTRGVPTQYDVVNNGFLLKKNKSAGRHSDSPVKVKTIQDSLVLAGIRQSDIVASSMYYTMLEYEMRGTLHIDAVAKICKIENKNPAGLKLAIQDRLTEFQAFKSVFFFN